MLPSKSKLLARNIYIMTRNKRNNDITLDVPTISFDELKVPFQYCYVMDLRDIGILHLSGTTDGNCGVSLKRIYADMTYGDFCEELRRL